MLLIIMWRHEKVLKDETTEISSAGCSLTAWLCSSSKRGLSPEILQPVGTGVVRIIIVIDLILMALFKDVACQHEDFGVVASRCLSDSPGIITSHCLGLPAWL